MTRTSILAAREIPALANKILREVAHEYGIRVGDLVGPRRFARLIEPRQVAAKRMREELDMTLMAIGTVLGGRHYSTIIYLLKMNDA